MNRLDWQRQWDRMTSSAAVDGVDLRVEHTPNEAPSFTWEVRGYSHSRLAAFEAAEKAALASLQPLRAGKTEVEALARAVQDDKAMLFVNGRPERELMIGVLRLALQATLAPVEVTVKKPTTKKRKVLGHVVRHE